MMSRVLAGLVVAGLPAAALASDPGTPARRDLEITAPDGVKLAATYFVASQPGPAVLLLHMCNTNRKSWEPLGPQLAAAGLHALALDYRGYGRAVASASRTMPASSKKS